MNILKKKENKAPLKENEAPVKKNKKSPKKGDKQLILLTVGILLIVIPLTVFGGILLHSALTNHSPVTGDRFKGDLDPAIKKNDISELEKEIKTIDGIEDCKIVLTTAQLRINVDTKDDLSLETIQELTEKVYEKVNTKLPINTYFTSLGNKKMYDLAINIYNFIDAENENMIYIIATKNSKMPEKKVQLVSEPLNEELAKELRGELEPTPTPTETGE